MSTAIEEALRAIREDIAELKEVYDTIEKRTRVLEMATARQSGFMSGIMFTAAAVGGLFVWIVDNIQQIANWLFRGGQGVS